MIQFLMLASAAVTAGAQIAGGIGAAQTAGFDAWQSEFAGRLTGFNIETERKLAMAEASQRSNDRLDIYRQNLSTNIASFAASGRDVGGQDRSVAAFLDRQKEMVGTDVNRIATMAQLNSNKMQAEAMAATAEGLQRAEAIRREGEAAAIAGFINAFSTIAGGMYQYNQITTPSGGTQPYTGASYAPRTSSAPPPRPTYFP